MIFAHATSRPLSGIDQKANLQGSPRVALLTLNRLGILDPSFASLVLRDSQTRHGHIVHCHPEPSNSWFRLVTSSKLRHVGEPIDRAVPTHCLGITTKLPCSIVTIHTSDHYPRVHEVPANSPVSVVDNSSMHFINSIVHVERSSTLWYPQAYRSRKAHSHTQNSWRVSESIFRTIACHEVSLRRFEIQRIDRSVTRTHGTTYFRSENLNVEFSPESCKIDYYVALMNS